MKPSRVSSSTPGLSGVQKNYCIKITKKIMDYPISIFFRKPVDPEKDNAPGYYDKIKKPMDLSTVLKHLDENHYTSVERWKDEMNLIWRNAMSYNPEGDYIHMIAKELNYVFQRFCEKIPKTELEAWIFRVGKKHAKLMKLIEAKPDPTKKLLVPATPPKPPRQTKVLLRQKSSTSDSKQATPAQ